MNNINAQRAKDQHHAANVVPFRFDEQEIRSILIGEQPWFVASDVAAVLQYRDAHNMCRNLDDDEKGTHNLSTLSENKAGRGGGDQEMTVINESGLYSAILRSRKAEAKRFKKWVTNEVLPAIHRTGRYDIADATIGADGLRILHELIGKKIKMVPTSHQRKARAKIWSLVHSRFNVPRGELIPAKELPNACNFVAAYTFEGQWLPRSTEPASIDDADRINLYALCSHIIEAGAIYRKYRMYESLKQLGSPAGTEIHSRIVDGAAIANRYLNRFQPSDAHRLT